MNKDELQKLIEAFKVLNKTLSNLESENKDLRQRIIFLENQITNFEIKQSTFTITKT